MNFPFGSSRNELLIDNSALLKNTEQKVSCLLFVDCVVTVRGRLPFVLRFRVVCFEFYIKSYSELFHSEFSTFELYCIPT